MRKFIDSKMVSYYASENGDIFSISKKVKNKRKLILCVCKTGKWDKQGYLQFGINVNGKTKSFKVHSVIADLFVKKPLSSEKLEINHIDGDKHNNCAKNLEWITRKENTQHAHNLNLINKADFKRENNPFFNRTKHHISLIRAGIYLIENGNTVKYASERTGISYKLMSSYWNKKDDLWNRK